MFTDYVNDILWSSNKEWYVFDLKGVLWMSKIQYEAIPARFWSIFMKVFGICFTLQKINLNPTKEKLLGHEGAPDIKVIEKLYRLSILQPTFYSYLCWVSGTFSLIVETNIKFYRGLDQQNAFQRMNDVLSYPRRMNVLIKCTPLTLFLTYTN